MDKFSSSELDTVRTYLITTLGKQKRITVSETFSALKDKFPGQVEHVFGKILSACIKDGKLSGLKVVRGRYGGIRLDDGSSEVEEVPAPKTWKDPVVLLPKPTKIPPEVIQTALDRAVGNEALYEQAHQEIVDSVPLQPKLEIPPPPSQESIPPRRPKPADRVDLWIKDAHYKVPHSLADVNSLLKNVLEAKEDVDGCIKVNEVCYTCSEESLIFLDKFLFYFWGAATEINTD